MDSVTRCFQTRLGLFVLFCFPHQAWTNNLCISHCRLHTLSYEISGVLMSPAAPCTRPTKAQRLIPFHFSTNKGTIVLDSMGKIECSSFNYFGTLTLSSLLVSTLMKNILSHIYIICIQEYVAKSDIAWHKWNRCVY